MRLIRRDLPGTRRLLLPLRFLQPVVDEPPQPPEIHRLPYELDAPGLSHTFAPLRVAGYGAAAYQGRRRWRRRRGGGN